MIPAISQVCSLESPLVDDVTEYSAGGCTALEWWLTKLERHLEGGSVEDVKQLLLEHGMTASVASYQGGLLVSQGEQRREAWDLLARRFELCRSLDVETIVVACDVSAPLSQEDLERARASLVELARHAGSQGMRAALEFQSRAALGNNLQTAVALVDEVGSPHLGLCFDAFHYHVGPSKPSDLEYLTADNLFHVQVCDLADRPRELAVDSDRILPGDGEIDLTALVRRLRQIGYRGQVSVELMNPQIWQVSARQFGDVAMSALERLLGDDPS